MLLHRPNRANLFVWYWCHAMSAIHMLLGALIIGMLLARCRRSLANLGSIVVESLHYASNISRFSQHHTDDVVEYLNRACRREVNRDIKIARRRRIKMWVLLIDTIFQRKHALAMPNPNHFKEKSNGVPAGNHTFVRGILPGPSGLRIPPTFNDFLTKEFIGPINNERRANRQAFQAYRVQIYLGTDLIHGVRALLPADMEIWVVANNFFEGLKLDVVCRSLKDVYYIAPLGIVSRIVKTATFRL